ncbi:LuxR C-terminal-related transcriptional regulator [Microbacterium sp. SSW1-59]|uniref:LuxR C-terminal-related transcriptional regulator n=1 Tax=Microbacterium xanthum TaxID=3079794 RepID=UPI002AD25ADD|nr:LuxR C-terminal-related transcriptional regulator [Microbacterium sp. SSW1-59]MDZ8200425.1 LuxR C-terminal-related transcriptional regulator [Microbacterium sp. SSW1-59]
MNFNDPDRARDELERAMRSGSPQAIVRAATANIWPLYCFHHRMLVCAVEALPSALLDRHPALKVVHPMTPVLARGARPFKPLVYQDDARSMSPDELDLLTMVQMIAFRFSGDVAAALIYARRLEERILKVPTESRSRVDGPLWFFHFQIGTTLLTAGDTTRALREFATARQLAPLCGQPGARRVALARTALAHAVRGSRKEALRFLSEAEREPEPQPGAAHADAIRATEAAATALVQVETLPDADVLFDSLEGYDSIEVSWPFALLARVRFSLATQRPHDALETLMLARDAHPTQHGSFAGDVVTSGLIEAYVAMGDLVEARDAARRAGAPGILTRLAEARLHLAEGRYGNAVHGLQLILADTHLGPGARDEARALLAWAEYARDGHLDPLVASRLCRQAADISARRMLATVPRQLVAHVAEVSSPDAAQRFTAVVSDLTHPEMTERPKLTAGELRVLNALPRHETTAEIASTFHVSPNTVKSQLASLYRKLGCASRDEAVRVAARLNLLSAASGPE